jgi:hypothetical protein
MKKKEKKDPESRKGKLPALEELKEVRMRREMLRR